jgi:5-methylcytosine-specific restriction protein A
MAWINFGVKKQRDRTIVKSRMQKIYQDKRWKAIRKAKFAANPVCEECDSKGITTQTDEIHHIVPIEVNPDLAFEWDNLKSLCVECHKKADRLIKIEYR